MQGNGLRELRRLGVWDAVRAAGYPFDSLGLRAPDPAGTLLAEIPDARTGGPDLPATLGLPRPALARIMADRATAAGAKLRLGTSVSSLSQDGGGVGRGVLRRLGRPLRPGRSARTASGQRPGA